MHRYNKRSCVTGKQNKNDCLFRRVSNRVPLTRPGQISLATPGWKPFPEPAGRLKRFLLIFLLISVTGFAGVAQTPPPSEYQIKAAFLYNFARFVEWPPQAFPGPRSPIVIGVLGKNVFGDSLEQTIRNKALNDHPFQFQEFQSVKDAAHCQVLFISPSEKKRLPGILKGLSSTRVLTVSETDHFIEAGGMINFVIEDDEVHFEINNTAAKQAGLTISSKLLSLAVHRP